MRTWVCSRGLSFRAISCLVILACLEGLRALAGAPFSAAGSVGRLLLVLGVLEGASRMGKVSFRRGKLVLPRRLAAASASLGALSIVYALTAHTLAAWAVLLVFYVVWVAWSSSLHRTPWPVRLLGLVCFGFVGGAIPAAIGQIESRFSDEEFFTAVQVMVLSVCGSLLVLGHWVSVDLSGSGTLVHSRERKCILIPVWLVVLGGLVLGFTGVGFTIHAYQGSFYSSLAPMYPDVSESRPFVCGEGTPGDGSPGSEGTFDRLLARVSDNPRQGVPEYGMLALGTGEWRWLQAFRQGVMEDVRQARYTGPANSIKYEQYLAAKQAYYYAQVLRVYPDLFTDGEQAAVRAWLTAVNRRALTVEWVDWLYALAFSSLPEGPYENQENGAGLLAVLERYHLTNGSLSSMNRDYLSRYQRGWFWGFRNTDDAYIYQPEWIDNALFQSDYWLADAEIPQEIATRQKHAFEWLLLQALPDGAPLGYNHPTRVSPVETAYLGAQMLDDPRFLWWSARMLDWAEKENVPLSAEPGVERAVKSVGASPAVGSCLLYGDSGLPTQRGPLAPDKIVFRDGWMPDSRYLLLNLRFSGWHRYKATNTATLLYYDGPLAMDQDWGQPFPWMPAGRSAFRDKRIPRENLNGLLIPRSGMSAVLYSLTGVGGPWAQDPPHYARVERFETLGSLDISRTVIDDWRGWGHERTVYWMHGGPIVFVDRAVSDSGSGSAALIWHLVGAGHREGSGVWLREGQEPVRVIWSPEAWQDIVLEQDVSLSPELSGATARYQSPLRGHVDLATTWLFDEWASAEYRVSDLIDPESGIVTGHSIALHGADSDLDMLHNNTPGWIEAEGLATDGEAVVLWRTAQAGTTVCTIGGTAAEIALPDRPGEVNMLEGQAVPDGYGWTWQDGRFSIQTSGGSLCLKVS